MRRERLVMAAGLAILALFGLYRAFAGNLLERSEGLLREGQAALYEKTDRWSKVLAEPYLGDFPEDGLLNKLIERGLLRLDPETLQLVPPNEEAIFLADDPEKRDLYRLYRDTATGRAIAAEIRLFNAPSGVAGARDDRPLRKRSCLSLEGDSGWRARLSDPSLGEGAALVPDADPPFEFGFLSWDLSPKFGPWAAAAGLDAADSVSLTRDLEAGGETEIRTIGWPERATLNGAPLTGANIEPLCDPGLSGFVAGEAPVCQKGQTPDGAVVHLDKSAKGRLALTIRPAPAINPETRRLARERGGALVVAPSVSEGEISERMIAGGGRLRLVRLENLEQKARCRTPAQEGEPKTDIAQCERDAASLSLNWIAPAEKPPDVSASPEASKTAIRLPQAEIVAADGRKLFYGRGCKGLTPEAHDLQLQAMVGLGLDDVSSLSGQLLLGSRPGDPDRKARLSIDGRVQAAALKALQEKVAQNDKGWGAFVALRAGTGPEAGEILAVAPARRGASADEYDPWDLRVSTHWGHPLGPLSTFAWREGDVHFQPGSSFKPVTALGAMLALQDGRLPEAARADLRVLLEGAPANKAAALGLAFDGHSVKVGRKTINNSRLNEGYESNGRGARGPEMRAQSLKAIQTLEKPPPLEDCGQNGGLDLCGAMKASLNSYFIRLAQISDGPAVSQGHVEADRLHGREALATMLGRDGMGRIGRWDLAQSLWPGPESKELAQARLYARTRTDKAEYGLMSLKDDLALAHNAFGQGGVTISPLQMAAIYAGIARGAPVRPSLVAQGAGQGDPLPLEPRHLGALRAALWLVSNETNGTADDELRSNLPVARRLYAKTGTADIVDRRGEETITVWFAGWSEPPPDGWRPDPLAEPPAWAREPIAFACMITHRAPGQNQTGGRICAPAARDFFSALAGGRPR